MIFFNSKIIDKMISKSKYSNYFLKEKGFFVLKNLPKDKKEKDSIDFRNLVILSILRFIKWEVNFLYNRYKKMFWRNLIEKDDIFQDLVVVFIKYWNKYDGRVKVTYYFHLLSSYYIRSLHKKLNRRNQIVNIIDKEILFSSLLVNDCYRYDPSKIYELENEDKFLLNAVKGKLTEKEYTIFYLRYINNYSLDKIGKKFGLTRERIRQILNARDAEGAFKKNTIAYKLYKLKKKWNLI